MLGLGVLAVGCGSDAAVCADGGTIINYPDGGATCGAGTTLVNGVCTVTATASMCMGCQVLNTTSNKCEATAACCAAGTQLNAQKDGCEIVANHGSLVFSATADRIWSNIRYNNGVTLVTLGDVFQQTPTVPDATEIYLKGIGANTDPLKADKFGLHPPIKVFWDATGEHRLLIPRCEACVVSPQPTIHP